MTATSRRKATYTENSMMTDLLPYKVTPPPGIRVPRLRNAAGRCFELAGKFALEHPQATVVQGFVHPWVAHAWVEIDELVYDGTCKGLFSKAGYYEVAQAVPVRRFTAEEYTNWSCKRGFWGPCDELNEYARRHAVEEEGA